MRNKLLAILLFPLLLFSQNEFNNWHFGTQVSLNFNSGSPVLVSGSSLSTSEGSASVSDCDGNLLFYSDGVTVWNKNNQIMTNGSGLLGSTQGGLFSYPPSQPVIIVKRPESSGIYYIFTASPDQGIHYSMVNMNLNGGLGQVLTAVKNVNLSFNGSEKLAVTYHENGKDIWVVTHYVGNNRYHSFLVTKTGIQTPGVISSNGGTHEGSHGDLKISQNGKKIASVLDFQGQVFLGDFNNSTGVVSNTVSVSGFSDPHGCEFSPDDSKMYINDKNDGIVQFNMSAGSNSQILNNPSSITFNTAIYGSLQLAPDGKIYVANAYSSYLGVINNPNASGPACNFNLNGLYIGESASGYEVTNVTLTNPPSFNGPNSVSFNNSCFGDTVDFVLANTNDISAIQWDFGDPASGILNSSISTNPSHYYTNSGNYTARVTINYLCGSETINIPITISQTPILNFDDTVKVCSGIATNIGASPLANTTYSWSPSTGLNNSLIANPTLNLTTTSERSLLSYVVTATDGLNGCSIQKPIRINLINPIVDAGQDVNVCANDTFQIGSNARTNYQYLWSPSFGLVNATAAQTKAVLNNSTGNLITQTYTLRATLEACNSFDDVSISLKPLSVLNPPLDTTICSLDSLVLNTNGNQLALYQWSTNFGLSNTTAVSPIFSVANKTASIIKYTKVAQITFDGCISLDTVNISVYPQAGIDNYQYLCPGFGVAFSPFGQGISFLWSPNEFIDNVNASSPIVNPDSSKTYYLTVTDVFGCTYHDSVGVDVNPIVPIKLGPDKEICRGDTALLGGVGSPKNAIFSWNPVVFLSHPDSNYTFAFPDSSKTYIITSQSDTCTGFDTLVLTVNQLPPLQLLSDSSICYKDSIFLVASGALTYEWFPNNNIIVKLDSALVFPSDTSIYWVKGTDAKGCFINDSVTIAVRPLPQINLISDTSVCFTDSVQVFAQGGGKYSWSPLEWINNDTLSNPFLIPLRDTTFVVKVTGVNNCSNMDSVFVDVNPLPVIGIMSDTTICDGTKAYLWATGGVKYEWSPSTSLNFNNIARPISSTTLPITYQVIVTDNKACVDSAKTNIGINVTPESAFSYDYIASCLGYDVTFVDQSTNADSWFWNFGDGQFSISQSPKHVFSFGINAKTNLIVGNNNLCFDTASVNFDWKKLENYITISNNNILTPNNDNLNDCFEVDIEGDFESCTHIEVFDRWGLKMFDNQEFNGCFRGVNEYNFQNLSEGTYYYVITINDYVKNGFITIVK